MDITKLSSAVTQIVYLTIPPNKSLIDADSSSGRIWSEALDSIADTRGYQELRWARSVEQPDKVQLHIIRKSLEDHKKWASSEGYGAFLKSLSALLDGSFAQPVVRHVIPMTTFTSSPTTPFRAPVTGTAIYLRTTSAWHEGAWPCWTHVVRHVPGCTGIAGGKLLEPFNASTSATLAGASSSKYAAAGSASGQEIDDCYLVFVGWESIKAHSDYHHTKHFRDHGIILTIGQEGWREYGHVKFEGWRGVEGRAPKAPTAML